MLNEILFYVCCLIVVYFFTDVLNILFILSFILLVTVSGGILYLTTMEWRDRRRQDRDKRLR
jgi:5-bromo-4-chloroindolyl phosphate hydrolysis protein